MKDRITDPDEIRCLKTHPEDVVRHNREEVADHVDLCDCHPMKLNQYQDDAPAFCCDRDETGIVSPEFVDALDSMNFVWHLDERCTPNPECASLVEIGRPFRYINDSGWHEMIRTIRGIEPIWGSKATGVRYDMRTGKVLERGDLGLIEKPPRAPLSRIRSLEATAEEAQEMLRLLEEPPTD